MSRYLATFYTHLSAMLTCRALKAAGVAAEMSPVPRQVSASCGTCVRFEADDPCLARMDRDTECVYACLPDGGYGLLHKND